MDTRYLAKYLRISDDDEDLGEGKRESDSILNQRRVVEDYINSHEELSKYPVKEFVDDGVSGVSFNRPGIQSLLGEVKEKKIACIIVKDLSRFGRNYIEVGDYIDQIFPFMGVRFIAVSDHFDSSKGPAGLDIGFRNLMHDLYSKDLSKKIKSVKRLMQEKGAYSGGDVPYGYMRANGKGEAYVPDPEAAQIVRAIFLYAAGGDTTMQIAGKLNAESIPTPGVYKNRKINANYELKNGKGNLWNASQVSVIIRNEVYIGTFIGRKLSTVRPWERKRNEESEYVKIEGHHEGLVAEELFREAQNAVKVRKKREAYKKEENPSPLKGKVKCGCCGYGMSLKRTVKKQYYYCRMGSGCGSYLKIGLELLEKTVWRVLQKLAEAYHEEEGAHQSKKVQILSAVSRMKEQKRILEIQAEHCKGSRLDLYYQWKKGQLTKEGYSAKKEELTKKEAESKRELEILEQQMTETALVTEALEEKMGIMAMLDAEGLTKELVDELIERIDVYGEDRVEIKWKFNVQV